MLSGGRDSTAMVFYMLFDVEAPNACECAV